MTHELDERNQEHMNEKMNMENKKEAPKSMTERFVTPADTKQSKCNDIELMGGKPKLKCPTSIKLNFH